MPDVKFSNLYPYTDFHELNLDWVIKEVKFWSERVGKSIQKIELTGTVGLVDTYTITYSDGSTSTFDVTNGNGIASVAKTGTAGLIDTYTITFQDGSTTAFDVHNGTASIDPSLTLPDYAADAKVTGDRLGALEDHFVEGINLFNPNDPDIVDNVELLGNGTTQAKTGYFASGYIPVRPGQTICMHYPTGTYGAASKIIEYYPDKSYYTYYNIPAADRLTDANGYTYIRVTFSVNTQTGYLRVTGLMSSAYRYMYVYDSTMPSTYEAYTTNIKMASDIRIAYSQVTDVSVAKSDTDFVRNDSKNLTDLSAVEVGVIGNSSTSANIDATVTGWRSTDFIPVKPNTVYSLYVAPGVRYGLSFRGIPYFDSAKNYIGRIIPTNGISTSEVLDTITTPNNDRVAYIRTSYPAAQITTPNLWFSTMIFEGTWPGDMYIAYDGADRLIGAGLTPGYSTAYNKLFGASAVWDGDSICAADNDAAGGWPYRIANFNGMRCVNSAVSGGTIAENTGAAHTVSGSLDALIAAYPDTDYFIVEGGTNDADILGDAGIGTYDPDDFSAAYIAALNKDTFSGALESIFYRLVTQMKGAHIGYLIPQKMGHTEILVTRRRTYFDRAVLIAQKWGIPVIDLWNNLYFNWRLVDHWDPDLTSAQNEAVGNLYIDGQHLTTRGYEIQSPIIAEWLKSI